MEYKEIIDLALSGQDYSEKVKDFTEEQKTSVNIAISKAADEARKKELESLSAIRKEKNRVQELAANAAPDPVKEAQFFEKFQKEQEGEARNEFFSSPDYKVPEELKATFEETFKRLYGGQVSKNQIKAILVQTYAAVMGNTLIDARKKLTEHEKNAADYNAQGANVGSFVHSPEASKFSEAAKELYVSWQREGFTGANYSLERAQKIVDKGLARKL